MTPTIACVIIATERRRAQVERIIVPNVWRQDFDDVVIVGDWKAPARTSIVYRYFCVEPLTYTPIDALLKRDAGTLVTTADLLVYLCDDHTLAPGFCAALRNVADEPWDVIVPNRYTMRGTERVSLNNGEHEHYCGGHAGVFRRDLITRRPWSTYAHHRNWDNQISHAQIDAGAEFVWSPREELSIIDIEPQAEPWK